MNKALNTIIEFVGDIIKIVAVILIVSMCLQALVLNIAAYKIMHEAEKAGSLERNAYDRYMSFITFATDDVVVTRISPGWGVKVNKLGAPLVLELEKSFRVTVFDIPISIKIPVKVRGINQGHYGEGY